MAVVVEMKYVSVNVLVVVVVSDVVVVSMWVTVMVCTLRTSRSEGVMVATTDVEGSRLRTERQKGYAS